MPLYAFVSLLPLFQKRTEAAAAAIRQENLVSARGAAHDAFAMADISLTVLLDGKPHEGLSAAADRGFFSVPLDGAVNMPLANLESIIELAAKNAAK